LAVGVLITLPLARAVADTAVTHVYLQRSGRITAQPSVGLARAR
jgi:hypothetical protein